MSWNVTNNSGFELGQGYVLPGEAQEEASPTSPPVALTSTSPQSLTGGTYTSTVITTLNLSPNTKAQYGTKLLTTAPVIAGMGPQCFYKGF
jgi:hypothetical protein